MYSYICGPALEPYTYWSIPEMLKHWASRYPNKEAFVYYDASLKRHAITCKTLGEKAGIFGRFLKDLNVKKDDTVAVCMNNSIDMVIAVMGIHLTGAVPTTISKNMADGNDVISSVLELQASVLVVDGNEMEEPIITSLLEQLNSEVKHILCSGGSQQYQSPFVSFMDDIFQNETNLNESEVVFPAVCPEDIAIYFRTSGTTGKPKMVGHTHVSFLNNNHSLNEILGINSEPIFFCDRPLGWIVGSPRTFLASGTKRILVHPRLSTSGLHAEAICDIIEKEQCSHVYLPGYLVRDVLQRLDLKNKFAKVGKIICSGERIPKSFSQLLDGFCAELATWYGSTEANGVSVFMSRDPKMFEDGIVGTPQSGVEIKLVDSTGTTVPRGETGELMVRSIYRCSEYRGMPEKFAETVDNKNWLKTGDLGYIRHDGNVVLKGRNADLISMGTMKYFPWEIEKVLINCPGVDSVVAVPIPDARLNEVVCACVKPDKMAAVTVEELWQFCDETWTETATATGFSLKPRYFVILWEFPVNSSGKLDRNALARKAVAELGL